MHPEFHMFLRHRITILTLTMAFALCHTRTFADEPTIAPANELASELQAAKARIAELETKLAKLEDKLTKLADTDRNRNPNAANLLPYIDRDINKTPDDIAAKLAPLRDRKNIVRNVESARSIIATHKFETTRKLTINERVEVTGLYQLGGDIPGFGKKGDLFWDARVTDKKTGAVLAGGWISVSNGELTAEYPRQFTPPSRDDEPRDDAAQPDRFGGRREPAPQRPLLPNR